MKRSLFSAIALAVVLVWRALAGQMPHGDVRPHYRTLQVVEASSLVDKINETAAEGYRLTGTMPALGGSWAAILERVEASSEPYKYLLLSRKDKEDSPRQAEQTAAAVAPEVSRSEGDFERRINQAAAKGFRFLPRHVAQERASPPRFDFVWMEKPPGPPRVSEYKLIGFGGKMLLKATLNPTLWTKLNPMTYALPQLNAALQEGYNLECVVATAVVVMQRPAGAAITPRHDTPDFPSRYHSFGGYKLSKLQKRLQQEAGAGFHLLDFAPGAPAMWTAAVTEKNAGDSPLPNASPYQYMVFAEGLPKLEDALNAHAAQGYRLFPKSLMGSFQAYAHSGKPPRCRVIMEKAPGEQVQYRYRVLWAPRLAEMGEALEDAGQEGFRALGITNFNNSLAVVLEKNVADSASK